MKEKQNRKQEKLFSETESEKDTVDNPEIKNIHQNKERENPYITGSDRNQTIMFPSLVDDYVSEDNPVRFIDAYVENLDLSDLGFTHSVPKLTGRRSYAPSDLLKLYIYGYLKKIRSSRQLAQLTHLNVEVFWLLKKLNPDFRTIADFRKDNIVGIKKVCQEFTMLCKKLNLFGGELVAVDGSKFCAVNHNSKVLSDKDISILIKQIDENIEEYFINLEKQDTTEEPIGQTNTDDLNNAISKLKEHRENLSRLQESLKESGETQVAKTDPDCRKMRTGHQGIDMCYNVQIAVDSKHKLIIAHDVTNDTNDLNQLYPMAEQSKEILEVETLEITADKGYFNEEQIAECEGNKIKCYIPTPDKSHNKSKGLFTDKDFIYDETNDLYICPGEEKLIRTTEVIKHDKQTGIYKTKACKKCKLKSKCTISVEGRRIYRSEYKDIIETMQKRMKEDPTKNQQRKSIVEHPFGTLKHNMGHGYFLMRGKEKVSAEMSMSVLVYNMKRVMNIIGITTLMEILKNF